MDDQAAPTLPPLRSSRDPLFVDVAEQGLFADGKTFVDALPRPGESLARIQALYAAERQRPGFSLADFVAAHFTLPAAPAADFRTDTSRTLCEHIDALWPHLTRQDPEPDPAADAAAATLLPLPGPYVVPGGRFREIYYWDSYFTMLGLVESGQPQRMRDMVANFAWLIDRHGHIPNGTRTYYLSRSQPPFFSHMVELQAQLDGARAQTRDLHDRTRVNTFGRGHVGYETNFGSEPAFFHRDSGRREKAP